MPEKKSLKKTAAAVLVVCILIFAFYEVYYRYCNHIFYENLAGSHSWLIASTIKFVNNWLKDGALKLHFLNFEIPSSIEVTGIAGREPYVSYPTGSTLFAWVIAKLSGLDTIDCSFVKHMQQKCMLAETLMFGVFLYLFLYKNFKLSDNPTADRIIQIILAAFLAVFWMLLPANQYYLINSYFADQAVIMYVMAFVLLWYIRHIVSDYKNSCSHSVDRSCCGADGMLCGRENGKAGKGIKIVRIVLRVLETAVIFLGTFTDYYFWILIFIAFIFEMAADIINKKSFRVILTDALFYVIPVIAALAAYLWQLSYVDNWQEKLLATFLFRTGATDEVTAVGGMLKWNFCHAFADESLNLIVYYLVYMALIAVLAVILLIKRKSIKICFTDSSFAIVFIMIIGMWCQLALLSEHSAIHTFSMIKFGWLYVVNLLLPALLLDKILPEKSCSIAITETKSIRRNVVVIAVSVIFTMTVLNFPESIKKYYNSKYEHVTYPISDAIRENTDYNDVCFSYTVEYSWTPPHEVAVSGKCVYKISSAEELDTMFPELDENAGKILVIDKAAEFDEHETEAAAEQKKLADAGTIVYDDDRCTLVKLP